MRRSRERHLIAAFIVIAAFGAVGNMDYADAIEREAAEKLARPMRAKLIDTSTQAATIGECRRAGIADPVMTINSSRDGIQWFRRTCLSPKT